MWQPTGIARINAHIRIAGYAAIFGRVDRGGDVVERGAFAASLAERTEPLPLYWQHDPARRIGRVIHASEDRRGLRIIAEVDGGAAGVLHGGRGGHGLSFGYRVRQASGERPRRLIEVELVEISLVAIPMQPLARVHLMASTR